MIREGTIGDRTADGWVGWTTADEDWSWNASIGCGNILIVLGHGTEWGAPDDEHGLASIIDLASGDDHGEYSFPWCMSGVEQMARDIAEREEHPIPSNVVEAARELWFAMIQEGAARG